MISDDLVDVPVEVFGGYCPAILPENLPPGAANVAQDVFFPQAGVRTRGGLGTGVVFGGVTGGIAVSKVTVSANVLTVIIPIQPNPGTFVGLTFNFTGFVGAAFLNGDSLVCTKAIPIYFPFEELVLSFNLVAANYGPAADSGTIATPTQIPANASINGLKTYLTPGGSRDLMIWDSLGDLFKEDPQGTLTLINSRPYQNLFYQSQTLFGREYQAFSNAGGGFDIPRQYDDTYWDRVSQVGPAASPIASDISFAILAISRAATTGIITLQLAVPFASATRTTYLVPGLFMNVSGVTADASLDGSFPIATAASASGGTSTTVTLWGAYGSYEISAISRSGGTVTATLAQTPNVTASTPIVIAGVEDVSYDGAFTVATISGNTVTWAQAGANSVSAGGSIYIQNFTASVYAVAALGYGQPTGGLPAVDVFGNQISQFASAGTITVSGNSLSGWNGTFAISTTSAPAYFPPGSPGLPPGQAQLQGLTVIYFIPPGSPPALTGYGGTATASLPASSPTVTGVAGPAGHISQGLHNVSVAFITRQGAILKGAPPTSWNAGGGFLATLTGITTGPPNIAQRLLLFTPVISPPATTGTFYSLPTGSPSLQLNVNPSISVMLVPDNSTTTAVLDFSDAILISGFQAEYLFSELELGECAAMLGYNSRTVWLGERARVPNFLNLSFDGGFNGNVPNGWTLDPTNGAGGSSALAGALTADWGDAYAITGDGTDAIRGKITQSAYQDYLKVAIIQPLISYSVRVRLAVAGTVPSQGVLNINLQSTIGGFTTTGLQVNATALTSGFQEFTATFTDAALANPPTDLVLQLYASGTLTSGSIILVDSIEPFPLLSPFNASTARLSYAFNPEGFDAVTGQVQVRQGDGQTLRAGFPLRNSLYLAKDHYLAYVTDDAVNEPASWPVTEVSATIGICGPNAVDWNEEWAVFAERSGLYICWGSDPVKITPEIQIDATFTGRTSWASINWTAAYTIWVRIDKVNKQILVGAPINGATTPNVVFMLDYRWLDSAEELAMSPLVTYSSFTGKMLAHGKGRRWAIWNITSNSMCFAERNDGSAQPFFGNGVGNGRIYWQQDVKIQSSDNGVAIASQYQTYALPSSMEEQQMQLRAHRKLLGYLKFRAIGSGTLNLAVTTAVRSTILRAYSLSVNPAGDGERPVNLHGERFFITVNTTALGNWFQLGKLIACVKKDPVALVRGVSA